MYGVLSQIEGRLSLKNAWLPHIFFLDTNGTYRDLLSTDSLNPSKNTTVLKASPIGKREYVEMRRTYAQ